jgi:hypothetical protein
MQRRQPGLEGGDLVGGEIVAAMQWNDGQCPRTTAVKDRFLHRGRALVRNAVSGRASAGQLYDHLMVVPAAHVPTVAAKFLRQVLRGAADVEMMRQRQRHLLDGWFSRNLSRTVLSWARADASRAFWAGKGRPPDDRRPGGSGLPPPAMGPWKKPGHFHGVSTEYHHRSMTMWFTLR